LEAKYAEFQFQVTENEIKTSMIKMLKQVEVTLSVKPGEKVRIMII